MDNQESRKGSAKWRCPFVIPARLERATHSLEGCCSIQLSYGTVSFPGRGVQIYAIFPD